MPGSHNQTLAPVYKKESQKLCGDFFLLHSIPSPPQSGTMFISSELKCLDSSFSYFLLYTGARVSDMACCHYNLRQKKLFKNFAPEIEPSVLYLDTVVKESKTSPKYNRLFTVL